MHGLNVVAKRPPYAPDATGFGEDDARFLRREGFDTVRARADLRGRRAHARASTTRRTCAGSARPRTRCAKRGRLQPARLPPGPLQRALRGRGLARLGGAGRRPAGGARRPAARTTTWLMPALSRAFDHFWANDPGPGGVGLQDRYADGLAPRGRRASATSPTHGLRPAQRAVAGHGLAGVRQHRGLPAVRPREADAVLAADLQRDPPRRLEGHRLVRAQRDLQQRPRVPPRGDRAEDRAELPRVLPRRRRHGPGRPHRGRPARGALRPARAACRSRAPRTRPGAPTARCC